MKRLLIFLIVFCGQLFALSDVELLPKIMGPIKRDLESSKTWGEFFQKHPSVLSMQEIATFDQVIGLKEPLPKYQFSANMRVMTVGDQKIEIVNLKTMDFMVNGKSFRYQKDNSFLESVLELSRLKNKAQFSFYSLFSSVASAQNQVRLDQCDSNSPLLTKDMIAEIRKAFPSWAGIAAMVVAGDARLKEVGLTQAQSKQRCDEVMDRLQKIQAGTETRLIAIDCETKALGANAKLSFNVAGSYTSHANKNGYKPNPPNWKQEEIDKMHAGIRGQVMTRKQMDLLVNWYAGEVREEKGFETYRFNEKGEVVSACAPKGVSTDTKMQISSVVQAASVMQKADICAAQACLPRIKHLAKLNASHIDGTLMNTIAPGASERCKKLMVRYATESCYFMNDLKRDRDNPPKHHAACGVFKEEPIKLVPLGDPTACAAEKQGQQGPARR